MNPLEYAELTSSKRAAVVHAKDFADAGARTLIYGYTCARDTFHLYLSEEGEFVSVLYSHLGCVLAVSKGQSLPAKECVPNKRVYPERCDYAFCRALHELDVHVPYTTYTQDIPEERFYGKTLDKLIYPFNPEALSAKDFKAPFQNEFRRSEASGLAQGQIEGALTAIVFYDDADRGARWIDNIEGNLTTSGFPHHVKEVAATVKAARKYLEKKLQTPEVVELRERIKRLHEYAPEVKPRPLPKF